MESSLGDLHPRHEITSAHLACLDQSTRKPTAIGWVFGHPKPLPTALELMEHNCVSTSLFKVIIEKDPDPAGGCENIYRGTRSVCGAEAFASMLVCPPHLAFTTCQMRGLKLLKFDVFHKSMPTSMSGLNRDGILPVLSNAMRTNCVFSP